MNHNVEPGVTTVELYLTTGLWCYLASSIYPQEYPPQPTKAAILMPSLPRACVNTQIGGYTIPTTFSSIILSIILTHTHLKHTRSQPDQEAIPSSVPGVSSARSHSDKPLPFVEVAETPR